METTVETFPWDWSVTPKQFRGYLATNSAVVRLSEHERQARLDASEEIVARACAEAGTPTVPLHHEAYCVRWQPTH
jgi:hypothetical protein